MSFNKEPMKLNQGLAIVSKTGRYSLYLLFLIPGLFLLFLAPISAQTNFTVLKSFSGVPDGVAPTASMILVSNNIFYGTTIGGGVSNYGTIFTLTTDGSKYQVLKSFLVGTSIRDGLLLGKDGNLYATTYSGGTSNLGTLFSIHCDGTGYTVLHSFLGGSDGANPEAAVIEGSDGALYGTTYFANTTTRGTIFKINKDGSGYSILHNFTGTTTGDGQQVAGRLLQGSDGALYGTTVFGGAHNKGTVYTIAENGNNYSILYSFGSVTNDGFQPQAGLIECSNQLYGTCYMGGPGTYGTVFKLNKDGSGYTILHDFPAVTGDAERPNAELFQATDGSLYGGTDYGGTNGSGAIYKLNTDGTGYQMVRNFTGANGDGQIPKCALLQLSNGVLYGSTEYGGGIAGGCIFALSTSPFQPELMPVSVYQNSNVLRSVITSGLKYTVLRSTNLNSWSTVGTMIYPTNSYSDTNPPQPNAFYQLKQN